jgi:hypothetical protein
MRYKNQVRLHLLIVQACILLFLPAFAYASDLLVTLSPKVLEDGSSTDFTASIPYLDYFTGTLRVSFASEAANGTLSGVADSLNASTSSNWQVFLFPFDYYFRSGPFNIWLGVGAYYNYTSLAEKGFFNMPELMVLGHERVNSYTNDFSMHVLGPILDGGIKFPFDDWLNTSLSVTLIPIFSLWTDQCTTVVPLMDPLALDFSQSSTGSPYLFIDLKASFFTYISLAFMYEVSQLKYQVIDFNYDPTTKDFLWSIPERTVIAQSFKIEVALLLPVGEEFGIELGYGKTFNSTEIVSGSVLQENKQYFIFSAKKIH